MSKSSHHPKQRRQVLTEEEYTSTLSQIVQRDFFPELPELERQAAVLERRSQGDVAGAVAVRRAVRRVVEHEEALAEQEAEDEQDLDDNHFTRKRPRPLHQENLTGFHARVTNEDDQEFDSNQKLQVKANRERLEKLFRPQESSQQLPQLTMASDQYAPESNRIAAAEWERPGVRNGLFFTPTPIRNGTDKDSMEGNNLLTDGNNNGSDTTTRLMPPPANVVSKYKGSKLAAVEKHALVEYVPKHRLEKKIEPSQTRFPNKIVPVPSVGLVPRAFLDDRSETDGSVTDASTDLDAPMRPIDQERAKRDRKRGRANQSYVAMTPLVVPGSGNQSPITTWGSIDSTPIILSGQEETPKESSYAIPMENERDQAAREAESHLAKRAKKAKSSSNSKKRLQSLTPAATSLLAKTQQRQPSRSRDAFASSLRSSYTPKIRSKSSSVSSRRRPVDSAYNATPLASQYQKAAR